jgi:hypothetical protein
VVADDFNSANYITLKQFDGGWIWLKNISEASNRILPYLSKLTLDDMRKMADLLNGSILEWKLFNDTQWILRLMPLPDFIILYVLNADEEFGPDLKIFYHKSSIKVPTEDAYVFTEYLLELVGVLAKQGVEKAASSQFQNELISFQDLGKIMDPAKKDKMWGGIIGQRKVPLLKIDRRTAEQISRLLKVNLFIGKWQGINMEWCLKFDLLKNLSIYIGISAVGPEIQVYYTKNVINFESRRIGFFTLLYCNAIIREARKILGDALPKLSNYL